MSAKTCVITRIPFCSEEDGIVCLNQRPKQHETEFVDDCCWIYLEMPYIWIYSRKTHSDHINCSDQVLRHKINLPSQDIKLQSNNCADVISSQFSAPCSSIQMLGQFCFAQSGQQKAFRLGQEKDSAQWSLVDNFKFLPIG